MAETASLILKEPTMVAANKTMVWFFVVQNKKYICKQFLVRLI